MRRVAVIGNSGGGKSTMCTRLGRALNIPVYMIDKIQWKPGWVHELQEIVMQQQELLLALDCWIIRDTGSAHFYDGLVDNV